MRSIQTILLVWNLQRRAILTTKKVARTHSSVENFEILSVAPVLVDHLDGVLEGELVLHVSALVKDCRDGHLPRHVLPPHHHRHGQGQDNHHHWPPPHNSPRQVDQSARTKLFPHRLPPSPARQLPANWAGDSPARRPRSEHCAACSAPIPVSSFVVQVQPVLLHQSVSILECLCYIAIYLPN